MPVHRGLRSLDFFSFILFTTLVIASVFWSSGSRGGILHVEIEASGVRHVMPLSSDGELLLEGPVGETLVQVDEGSVSIVRSDCRDETCVSMGHISRPSGWIACLPNRIFVHIVSDEEEHSGEGDVDAGAF